MCGCTCTAIPLDVLLRQQPAAAYAVDNSAVSGQRVRAVIYTTDDFTQAGDRYRWFDPARQVCSCVPHLCCAHRGFTCMLQE